MLYLSKKNFAKVYRILYIFKLFFLFGNGRYTQQEIVLGDVRSSRLQPDLIKY